MTIKDAKSWPDGYAIDFDIAASDALMQLKGRDYMTVQKRMVWFLRDQRALIMAGLATTSFIIQTELIEMDRERGFAQFKTYIRDVLGNEATMYGSEERKDFGDFAEKASTKSVGRALLALGYGTAFAPEMDEGVRVVDAPRERRTLGVDYSDAPAARPAQLKPALHLNLEHLPPGTTATEVKQFADSHKVPGPQWGAMWKDCGGDLNRLWVMLRIHMRSAAASAQ